MATTKRISQSAKILLVSSGVFHPSWLGRLWLYSFLDALGEYRIKRAHSLEAIRNQTLSQYAAMVLYFHYKNISADALQALDQYTRSGGGLLALHSASASFKSEERYIEILGGRFERHGPVQNFQVEPAPQQGPVFQNIPAFDIQDELYRHSWESENQVHFSTEIEGMHEPVVWTRSFGLGRVCYCALGHRPAIMRHPCVQQILRQGLAWVCRSHPEAVVAP